jgi:hypothetical protein
MKAAEQIRQTDEKKKKETGSRFPIWVARWSRQRAERNLEPLRDEHATYCEPGTSNS